MCWWKYRGLKFNVVGEANVVVGLLVHIFPWQSNEFLCTVFSPIEEDGCLYSLKFQNIPSFKTWLVASCTYWCTAYVFFCCKVLDIVVFRLS
jgi:hypothetical protein